MLNNKAFIKRTKQGKVVKVVREHYLREDIYSGSPLDPECDPSQHKLGTEADHYLVVDTNVALQQIDFLEHTAVDDVILLSVVLEEVKHRSNAVYSRLRALANNADRRFFVFTNEHHKDTYIKAEVGETVNDRNDRAIRTATAWYASKVPSKQIILLTDDQDNCSKARQQGLAAMSTLDYAISRHADAPDLADLVARGKAQEAADKAAGLPVGTQHSTKKRPYQAHRSIADLQSGLQSGLYHQGTLRVSRYSPWQGYVSSESVGADLLIKGRYAMNRAIDGDVVVVELLPQEQWQGEGAHLGAGQTEDAESATEDTVQELQPSGIAETVPVAHEANSSKVRPCGIIVGIIKRNWRTRGYCGALQPPKSGNSWGQHVLFCPVERKYPFIKLQTHQAETLADKRIVVVIDSWKEDSTYPTGHYVRTLGVIGDKNTETEVLLLEHDVNSAPFSNAVNKCVPPLPWSVTETDRQDPNRLDLRDRCICSVDPPGCRDIDDALHVRKLDNGNYELGVHIADVTHFLQAATAMDLEASQRGTTVYLVNRRIDMLPKPLTEDICSLRAGVERLAFSVLWEMTPDVHPVNITFTKSLINSRAALTYQEAQTRIDDRRMQDETTSSLRDMLKIAQVLRRRRMDAGALQLASPEVKFAIDQATHDPTDVSMYEIRATNQMVEEMMLLANCTVADHIFKAFPSCALLRRHPVPAPRQFEPLLNAAAAVGLEINPETSKTLAASLDCAVRPDDPYFNKLIRIMATRCMTQALYFGAADVPAKDYYHYGLAASIYTHFTSPIRRYADVMVHRLLAASLALFPLPESSRDKASVHSLSLNLNERHHNAQLAGRASVELHTLIFFDNRTVVADARVTKVKANGLVVFVPKYGIEGPVYFDDAHNDTPSDYLLDEKSQTVSTVAGNILYRIFDKAAVRISVKEGFGHRKQLLLELVDRTLIPTSELAVL